MKGKMQAGPQLWQPFEAKNKHRLKKSWERLLTQEATKTTVETLIKDCKELNQTFFPFTIDNVSATLPDWIYCNRPHDCSVHFNAGLFTLLRRHVTCRPEAHCLTLASNQSQHTLKHLSRLCLDSGEGDDRGT